MDYSIDYKPTLRELQAEVASILSNATYIKDRSIQVLSEDLLDIDYQIKNALGKQGLVVIVNTLQATYIGHDGLVNAWQIDNLEVDVVENPSVWRPYLKKHGFEDGTTTDLLHMMAEILGGPQSGIFGKFNPKSIEVGEDSALVVGKLKLQTTVRQNVEGVVEEPTKVEIPFVTKVEISDLIDEIDSLKALVEGFSTEQIKSDIADLKEADTQLGATIDGLADVYQPKGSYALKSDLAPYALKTQIPVEISQLNNNVGYITEVYWDEVKQKPDVALASDIPANVSQLENDAGYLTSVSWSQVNDRPEIPENTSDLVNDSGFLTSVAWNEVQDKPDVATKDDVPTKTSELANDSGFITSVAWNDVQGKPSLVDDEKLNEAVGNRPTFDQVDAAIDEKIADIPQTEDAKKLWNDTKTQYISGSREVFGLQTIQAHYTEWEFSDGEHYELNIVEKSGGEEFVIYAVDTLHESKTKFATYEEAYEVLSTATRIVFAEDVLVATRQFIEEQQTLVKIADLATTSQIPTKTSQLENDSGYLTSHQSLDGFATTEYVDVKVEAEATARKAAVDQINSELIEKANAADIPTKTSQLQNDSGFITEHQSLDGYATAEYVNVKVQAEATSRQEAIENVKQMIPTKTSDLTNDSGFLTEHQSLDGYATKQYVDEHVPEEIPWNKVSGKPDLVQKDQFDAANKNLQNQIDEINVGIEGKVEVDKVYGQYKARYIDGDGRIFEKQTDGSYSQTGTLAKTSDLKTKTSQLENDSGFLTEVDWDNIQQKPAIPTKLSELQNDEGFLKDVTWEQVQNKPDIATDAQFEEFRNEVDGKLANKLDIKDYDATAIKNSSRKIDANGYVYSQDYTPGYYTPWTYSDGNTYADPLVYGSDETGWRIAIDQDTYVSQNFETQQQAQSFLDTALSIDFTLSATTITATREYVDPVEIWTKTDELACKSDIKATGISEEECRTIVTGYGYQTAEQVESTINGKGFRTESQVESQITAKGYQTSAQVQTAITSKGYQTESQVRAIAAATLPTGYADTLVVGTLTDGTEVRFNILTKAIS